MKILELIRLEESASGTIGVLKINKQVFCYTLEPPDNANKSNISSIPAQQYFVVPYSSPKYPDTYHILGVPDRSAVLIHPGNTVHHTAGCILLGATVGKLKGDRAVLNSGATFERFRALCGKDDHHLTIREVY